MKAYMNKLLLLCIFLLSACTNDSETSYSLRCNGQLVQVVNSVTTVSNAQRSYEINSGEMKGRNCSLQGNSFNCYKEVALSNSQREKLQLTYNTGDYSLSEVSVIIGIDQSTNGPIFVKTEMFRSTCPMTVKRVKKTS
jgi:hypothetical protein